MKTGIDGDMWYCSNGFGLESPSGKFTFERTLRDAATKYQEQFGGDGVHDLPTELKGFLDITVDEYRSRPGA